MLEGAPTEGMMLIVGARWTPKVNMLMICCTHCGNRFEHRADRWKVMCVKCGKYDSLKKIRQRPICLPKRRSV